MQLARSFLGSPDEVTWHHPFVELWAYRGRIGLHHIVQPDVHTPPRYLLSGQAWFRLWRVCEIIELCCGPHWHPTDNLYGELSLLLHPELSYPAVHGPAVTSTVGQLDHVWGDPNVPVFIPTTYGRLDITPRMAVHRVLRRWIHARRSRRALARQTLLLSEHLLPGPLLALPHLVEHIASYL